MRKKMFAQHISESVAKSFLRTLGSFSERLLTMLTLALTAENAPRHDQAFHKSYPLGRKPWKNEEKSCLVKPWLHFAQATGFFD